MSCFLIPLLYVWNCLSSPGTFAGYVSVFVSVCKYCCLWENHCSPSPPIDSTWTVMIVWRWICCTVYNSRTQWFAYAYEQFLNLHVGLGLNFVCVCLSRFAIVVFIMSVLIILFLLVAFIVLRLLSSVPSQEIGWKEHLQNELFRVKWDVKL